MLGALFEEGWASLSNSFLDVISSTPSKLASALATTPSSAAPSEAVTAPVSTSKSSSTTLPVQSPVPALDSAGPAKSTPLAPHVSSSPTKPQQSSEKVDHISSPSSTDSKPSEDSTLLNPSKHSSLDSSLQSGTHHDASSEEENPSSDDLFPPVQRYGAGESESRQLNTHQASNGSPPVPLDRDAGDAAAEIETLASVPSLSMQADFTQDDFGNWDADPWGDDPSQETATVHAWDAEPAPLASNKVPSHEVTADASSPNIAPSSEKTLLEEHTTASQELSHEEPKQDALHSPELVPSVESSEPFTDSNDTVTAEESVLEASFDDTQAENPDLPDHLHASPLTTSELLEPLTTEHELTPTLPTEAHTLNPLIGDTELQEPSLMDLGDDPLSAPLAPEASNYAEESIPIARSDLLESTEEPHTSTQLDPTPIESDSSDWSSMPPPTDADSQPLANESDITQLDLASELSNCVSLPPTPAVLEPIVDDTISLPPHSTAEEQPPTGALADSYHHLIVDEKGTDTTTLDLAPPEIDIAESSPHPPVEPLENLAETPSETDFDSLQEFESPQPISSAEELPHTAEFPTVAKLTVPVDSNSESPQLRHLQSKLDVLTRILDERERQLAARSTTMAEVQNENAQLKAELEVFNAAHAKALKSSSNNSDASLIESLQEEFSERISSMEQKYRVALKERQKIAEQLKATTQQLEATVAQVSAMATELEGYRSGKVPQAAPSSTTPVPSTPSRLIGQVFNSTPSFGTPGGADGIMGAFSSLSSLLASPSQSDLTQAASQQTPSRGTTPSVTDSDRDSHNSSPRSADATPSLEEELRAEGTVLHEKVQRFEKLVRDLRAREKSHLAEIKQLEAKVASQSLELQSNVADKKSAESESSRARESEKKLKNAMEAQKDALDIKAKQLSETVTSTESLERETSSLKTELESSWRLNESLRKELEQKRVDDEQARRQLEAKYQALNLESSAAIVSKSTQQHQMLQATINELRLALDGNKTLKSTQEEALEGRVSDLETALLSAEQHLTMSRQAAELAQAPLLKQISDLQAQLAHQQRALEVVEEAWKGRAQELELSLTSSSKDLASAQSQVRSAEMSSSKLQSQYARLEHQHQTLQIEFDQVSLELSALQSDKDSLEQTIDSLQSANTSLSAKLSGSGARSEEILADQRDTISRLEGQITALNQRVSSLTTPGYSTVSLGVTQTSSSLRSSTGSTSPTASRGHSPTPSLVSMSSASLLSSTSQSATPVQTPQKSAHTATAMETQLALLRAEKSRIEEMLTQALHTASKSEALEASLRDAEEAKLHLQERLDAALELVAEQSERLQFSDEEVAETKQLYKEEIAHLVSQLQELQTRSNSTHKDV